MHRNKCDCTGLMFKVTQVNFFLMRSIHDGFKLFVYNGQQAVLVGQTKRQCRKKITHTHISAISKHSPFAAENPYDSYESFSTKPGLLRIMELWNTLDGDLIDFFHLPPLQNFASSQRNEFFIIQVHFIAAKKKMCRCIFFGFSFGLRKSQATHYPEPYRSPRKSSSRLFCSQFNLKPEIFSSSGRSLC